ncbi:MAG: NADP-dependent malic enzyme [Alphaproteobacteria bacterium]|nr:NADP-dependent malic enzyme [Alphaproteobacteria bacterium]
MTKISKEKQALDQAALHFHQFPKPGKLEITATKPLGNQRDLALAYSPGVAAPCLEIEKDPMKAADYTARANLVAVISNGTAVLGLGAIGALASKPVMEGKAVLFKKFAGIDVFDIEVDELDPDKFIDTVASLEPTFGGINLEDIKAPECFYIEEELRKRMKIPVFHDDQHGTAIIVGAAVINALHISGKKIEDVQIVASGAGAAAIACLNLLVSLGAKRSNILITDSKGVVYKGRNSNLNKWKGAYERDTPHRTLEDCMDGADIFLGLSKAGILEPHMLKKMAKNPLILALSNPIPEIMPELAREVRPDSMICTGRSDFVNQVNNVLCFPFLFRGALDVMASAINEEMKMAAVHAIAALAREPILDDSAAFVGGNVPTFGVDYLIPNPFDPRLILHIAPAVAKAAEATGVALRPLADMDAYISKLERFVFRSGMVMKPIVERAKQQPKRVIFADGEDERVLRAAQVLIEEGSAVPMLIGRPQVIEARLKRYGLNLKLGSDIEVINPEDDPRYNEYVERFHSMVIRKGVTPDAARTIVRTNTTVIGALAVDCGDADALICGLQGRYIKHIRDIKSIIGLAENAPDYSALSLLLIADKEPMFLADTYVTEQPTCDEIVAMAAEASVHFKNFGIEPKVAMLSYSNFGSRSSESTEKMNRAYHKLRVKFPDMMLEGEMQGDMALNEDYRKKLVPNSSLQGSANLLLFPNLDASNLSLNLLKEATNALHVGPILMGTAKPAHVITPSVTTRGLVNIACIAAVEAQQKV